MSINYYALLSAYLQLCIKCEDLQYTVTFTYIQ